jgi:hypothetical protein
MKSDIMKLYIDWVNNFLTIDYFAECYGITKTEAKFLIKMGKKYYNSLVKK